MDRRELLKMAAKAAGIKVKWITRHDVGITDSYIVPLPEHAHHFILNKYPYPCWDPLEDDGDALRLLIACELETYVGNDDEGKPEQYVGYRSKSGQIHYVAEPHGSDVGAATRRAIVRAAAEIGRAS